MEQEATSASCSFQNDKILYQVNQSAEPDDSCRCGCIETFKGTTRYYVEEGSPLLVMSHGKCKYNEEIKQFNRVLQSLKTQLVSLKKRLAEAIRKTAEF